MSNMRAFCFFLALAKTPSTVLNGRSETRYAGLLFPNLRGDTFSLLWSRMVLVVGLSWLLFIRLEKFLSVPSLLRVFFFNLIIKVDVVLYQMVFLHLLR